MKQHHKRPHTHHFGSSNIFNNLLQETGLTQENISKVSNLTEQNMVLLEKDLIKLDKTLSIYNITGVLLGLCAVLGSVSYIQDIVISAKKNK